MDPYNRSLIAQSIKRALPKPKFELTEKQLATVKTVSQLVLAVGVAAGTLALTVLAPNIFQALDKMPWARKTYRSKQTKRKDQLQKVTKAVYYLKRQGYVELVPDGDDFKVKIKKKGRKKIQKMQFGSLEVSRRSTWDGRWWAVIADVPSKDYRVAADRFREKLKKMNFYPLQRTVWFFPFDPRDEVDFVAAYYGIERFVTTMEVSKLDPEDGGVLTKFFKAKNVL